MIVRLLLIDTCGAVGSLALAEDGRVVALERLDERASSAALLPALGRMMAAQRWSALDAVGVVSGPGSFTGVRVGLAAAKGLCEGMGARLEGVSRLQVLADTARLSQGYAVLDAGRGELYVRGADGVERLMRRDALTVDAGARVVVAEPAMVEALKDSGAEMIELDAGCALGCVMAAMEDDAVDAALVDANYVRAESDIYARSDGARRA